MSKFGRFLLGDEMGVGKTIQALAVASIYREDWPLVIVCPATLRFNWRDEINKWLPEIKNWDINMVQSSKTFATVGTSALIHIMSYEIATKVAS